jgi:hypothetical protein
LLCRVGWGWIWGKDVPPGWQIGSEDGGLPR